jgi:hypothetical protein
VYTLYTNVSFSGSAAEHAKSAKLTKLEARYDIPHVRELELPMSPIGQPSILDVTDVPADDQELSLYGPPEPVKSQPRMSTQKLPHLIKREGSRYHTKNDISVYIFQYVCMYVGIV